MPVVRDILSFDTPTTLKLLHITQSSKLTILFLDSFYNCFIVFQDDEEGEDFNPGSGGVEDDDEEEEEDGENAGKIYRSSLCAHDSA